MKYLFTDAKKKTFCINELNKDETKWMKEQLKI